MCYLRHHGFPSPLLDWTRSPYVATFFAFRKEGDPNGRVAIFVYRETAGSGKVGWVGAPGIEVRGPYMRTHRRHFLQQCQYTVCMEFKASSPLPEWHYASHEAVFAVQGGLMMGRHLSRAAPHRFSVALCDKLTPLSRPPARGAAVLYASRK